MSDNKKVEASFFNMSKEVKLIMLATLITNIGNGMYTIAVSKLVYDKTNSAMAFGGVMILQYIVMFSVQFLSGSLVDRNNPKHVSIICDLISGFLVVSSGLMVFFTNIGLFYLFIAVIFLNIVAPFFSSANFSLVPMVVEDKTKLLKMNGLITTLFQAGQLLGCALVAPVIYFFNPQTALVIDGITFFLSALFISFTTVTNVEVKKDNSKNIGKNLLNDWKEIGRAMKQEKSFAAHLFIASGDYLSINFFNVMLVPMVTLWYKNNSFYISLYDGGFAVGAMLIATFVVILSKKIGTNNSAFIGLFVQAIIFGLMILSRNPLVTFLIILIFGALNSFSVAIFTSNLQQRSVGPIKGRVGSIKSFIVSCFSIVLIPIISKLHDISITYGLAASCGIILTYSLISFLFGRKFAFGDDYLLKTVEVDNTPRIQKKLDMAENS
ncbi:MFS transporter [Clostridium sp. C8-1-8]|uniref:MFS transporter n=1 Tax=Clostridium sp. C8-1-8 TaxID=2698831 RepID=UPI0013698212|nr:MFS transporter [Clostridium sp. C8-1-8]